MTDTTAPAEAGPLLADPKDQSGTDTGGGKTAGRKETPKRKEDGSDSEEPEPELPGSR